MPARPTGRMALRLLPDYLMEDSPPINLAVDFDKVWAGVVGIIGWYGNEPRTLRMNRYNHVLTDIDTSSQLYSELQTIQSNLSDIKSDIALMQSDIDSQQVNLYDTALQTYYILNQVNKLTFTNVGGDDVLQVQETP